MSIPFTWVYLIHDNFTGLYKIGKSDKPYRRLDQLRSSVGNTIPAAPAEYTLYEAWLCPEQTESSLHKQYAEQRVRGEWFDLSKQDVEAIERLLGDHPRKLRGASTVTAAYEQRLIELDAAADYYAFILERLWRELVLRQKRLDLFSRQRLIGPPKDSLIGF